MAADDKCVAQDSQRVVSCARQEARVKLDYCGPRVRKSKAAPQGTTLDYLQTGPLLVAHSTSGFRQVFLYYAG